MVLLCAAMPSVASGAQATHEVVTAYAAASLTDVLQEITTAFTRSTGIPVRLSFASSAILARQIEAGADADLFLSADLEWMNYLQQRGLLRPNTRQDLLGNRLVLIAPINSKVQVDLQNASTLLAALGRGRLALGDPAAVPAGRYARGALQSIGVWHAIEGRTAYADNVRGALAFVARGEAPLGVVYATDAKLEPRVRVVAEFEAATHAPIVYPVALTRAASPGAVRLLEYLRSDGALARFKRYGFATIKPAGKAGASSGAAHTNKDQARQRFEEITGTPRAAQPR